MSDGLLARYWRSLIEAPRLPRLPEPAVDEPGDGRTPGLVDEAN